MKVLYSLLFVLRFCSAAEAWKPNPGSLYPTFSIETTESYELDHIDINHINATEDEITPLAAQEPGNELVPASAPYKVSPLGQCSVVALFGWGPRIFGFLPQLMAGVDQLNLCGTYTDHPHDCGLSHSYLALTFTWFAVWQVIPAVLTCVQANLVDIHLIDSVFLILARLFLVIGIPGLALMHPTGENMLATTSIALAVSLLFDFFFFAAARRNPRS